MSMRPYNAKQVTLSEERVYDLIHDYDREDPQKLREKRRKKKIKIRKN